MRIMGWSEPMTYRQFLMLKAWGEMEWNRPSRTDGYIMLAAHEARFSNATKRPAFDSKHYTLTYSTSSPQEGKPQTEEERQREIEARKKIAIKTVGGKVVQQYITRDGIPCDKDGNPL